MTGSYGSNAPVPQSAVSADVTVAHITSNACNASGYSYARLDSVVCPFATKRLEAIQRWSGDMSRVTLNSDLSKFLLCISSQGQDLYSHQKLNMYIYWFSSESGYRRR